MAGQRKNVCYKRHIHHLFQIFIIDKISEEKSLKICSISSSLELKAKLVYI